TVAYPRQSAQDRIEMAKGSIAELLCFAVAGALQAIGSVFTLNALLYAPASVVGPIWNTQPIISFFLARVTLKGIEVVTFRDGISDALVVMDVLVMRWASIVRVRRGSCQLGEVHMKSNIGNE